jgi:hypothetical protein
MKLFTVQEVNELIPAVRLKLERLSRAYAVVASMREIVKAAAAESSLGGGGVKGGSRYVDALNKVNDMTREMTAQGIQIKDYGRGLIDFPCLRDGRVVLLCWQLGEREEIEWWHEADAGFAGRRRL